MSAGYITVATALWAVWVVGLCRRERISWMPLIPVVTVLGFGAVIVLNTLLEPIGTIAVSLALMFPIAWTVEVMVTKRRHGQAPAAQSDVAPDGSPSLAPASAGAPSSPSLAPASAGAPSSAPRVNAGIGQTKEGPDDPEKDGH